MIESHARMRDEVATSQDETQVPSSGSGSELHGIVQASRNDEFTGGKTENNAGNGLRHRRANDVEESSSKRMKLDPSVNPLREEWKDNPTQRIKGIAPIKAESVLLKSCNDK